jgi:transposase
MHEVGRKTIKAPFRGAFIVLYVPSWNKLTAKLTYMEKHTKNTIRRSQRDYSLAFKLQVVQQVEKGELTYKKAQRQYGIQGRSTVLVWLRKHGTLDWTLPKQYTLDNDRELTPEQRIKQLEAALKDEQDRNLIYKTMFDILQKEHGIALPKKSLPKQSKGSKPKE